MRSPHRDLTLAALLAAALLGGCTQRSGGGPPDAEAEPSGEAPFTGSIGKSIRDSEPSFRLDPVAAEGAPNVVVILADDLGFADLGSYGSEIRTPNLDRLASRGLRYNHFTVTAICSATRAALLTGLDHHSAGVGWLAEWDFGYPGYRGELAPDVATLPQILRQHGYATFAAGKWHLANGEHRSRAGPFDAWPTQKGFDRYWGFLEGETDHFDPAFLVSGNEVVERPEDPDYYFPDDLTEHALQMLRDLRAVDARRPFFLYYAPGAVHAPHHTREADRRRYEGRYAAGWDALRAERLARQKRLGIAPANTELTPRNPRVEAWDALTPEQRRMYARFQENYAGFVDNLDQQVGRLLDHLERSGELDDTIVVFLSDNGASPEGDVEGQANGLAFFHHHTTTTAENLRHFDALGGPSTHPHYPLGWAQVGNTPFRHTKRTTHGGGVRVPLIVSWPRGIAARGEIRSHFHHVTDLAPTLLEVIGIEPPAGREGAPLKPIEGVSFAYTFAGAAAPARRLEQYYEMEASRAYEDRGFRLVAHREGEQRYDEAPWELYDLGQDFSEAHDLAARHPEKVKELEAKWWRAAERHQVLPLVDVGLLERSRYAKFVRLPGPDRFEYAPGGGSVPQTRAPVLPGRSYTITATVRRDDARAGGVLVAQGDRFSGYALFVRDNRLVYERNVGSDVLRIESPQPLPTGAVTLAFRFEKVSTGVAVAKGLLGEGAGFDRLAVLRGTGSLWVDGRRVAAKEIARPFMVAWEGLDVGRDTGSPVSPAYAADSPFAFAGELEKVVYEIE